MCEKKSTLVIDDLQEILNKLNSLSQFDVDTLQKQAKVDLDNMKKRLVEQISIFFDNLYKDYSAKISGTVKKVLLKCWGLIENTPSFYLMCWVSCVLFF